MYLFTIQPDLTIAQRMIVTEAIGRILPCDYGKQVWRVDGVFAVENDQQKHQRELLATIRTGDRVTILIPAGIGRDGQEWKEATGRAVMRNAFGWALNMGGKYGTPGVVTAKNLVRVKHVAR